MKMRQLKKVLSITLASAMLISSVPAETFASETNVTEQSETQEENNGEGGGSQPIETAPTTEPTQPMETAPTTEPAQPVETAPTTEPTQPVETAPTTEPTQPTETVPTTDSTDPTEATSSTEPAQLTEATPATEPTEAAQTTDPVRPMKKAPTTKSTEPGGENDPQVEEIVVSWKTQNGEAFENGAEFTWNGKDQLPVPTAEGAELVCDITEAKEPGTYTVNASISGDASEKKLENASVTFTIKKAQVSVQWKNLTEQYTGNGINIQKAFFTSAEDSATEESLNVAVADTDTGNLVNGEVVNAGKYNVVAALTEAQAAHYELKSDGSARNILTVQAPVVINWTEETSFVYKKGSVQKLTATGAKATDGTEFSISQVIKKDGQEAENPEEAGTYTVEVTVAGISDKDVYPVTGETEKTFEIVAKSISVTWEDESVTYDGKAHYLSVSSEDIDVTDSSIVSIAYADSEGNPVAEPQDVGGYKATLSVVDTNYALADAENQQTRTLTIEQAEAEIKWKDTEVTYNGDNQKPSASFTDVDGNTVTCEVTLNENLKEAKDAGDYQASVNVNAYPNYKLSKSTETFSIRALEVTVTPNDEKNTIYYGQPIPEDQFAYDIACVNTSTSLSDEDFNSFVKKEIGEKILSRIIEEGKDGDDHDSYKLVFNEGEKAGKKNYDLTLDEGHYFVINKLPVTITAVKGGSNSKIYGANDPDTYDFNAATDIAIKETVDITAELKAYETAKEGEIRSLLKRDETKQHAGFYDLTLALEETDNYQIIKLENGEKAFEITRRKVTLKWEKTTVIYNGENQKPTATFTGAGEDGEVTCEVAVNGDPAGARNVDAKGYTASVNAEDYPDYDIANPQTPFTIKALAVTVTPDDAANVIYYGQPIPENRFAYNIACENTSTSLSDEDFNSFVKGEIGEEILRRIIEEGKDGDDHGSYELVFDEKEKKEKTNYDLNLDGGHNFTIRKLPVEISAVKSAQNSKIYGGDDPAVYAFEVNGISDQNAAKDNAKKPADILSELQDYEKSEKEIRSILTRDINEETENAGCYKLKLAVAATDNYEITLLNTEEPVFEIEQLPIIVHPTAGQSKTFSEADPDTYAYSVEIDKAVVENKATNKTAEDVENELGSYVLERAAGEAVYKYLYSTISSENGELYKKTKYDNFQIKVAQDVTFEIKPVVIESVQSVNSRQNEFKVTTNLDNEVKKVSGVTTKLKIEAVELPVSADGITFSTDIDDYINEATDGIVFSTTAKTITVNEALYQKTRKDNKQPLEWSGYLPAGTKLRVSVIDDNYNVVSAESKEVTVTPVAVEFNWQDYKTSESTGNYVVANGGAADALSLSGNRAGEWVELLYSKNGRGSETASYDKLDLKFIADVNNSGLTHVMQSVTANIVDTLNLTCTSKTLQFYVDDTAFTIPASSIQFENRGEEITIHLPEMGTITSVTIPGAEVTVDGSMSQEFTFPVSWSGKNLIPTGTGITIAYTDQAGHQGTGTAAASRSSVSTPITFRIRPELNANGYLNGRSSTLIVSGTACACEPIQVTVAGMSQSTNATVKDVWSDSNGSWEVLFDMTGLPEEQEFSISAEYTDVNGSGYSITARFDAFCASPSVVSPIYEAMTHISGMVEPGTAVALVVNGENQNYYEIQVDRFGHFAMDDVPMMFGGEDSFDIYVTDIAGNVSIRHYDIAEPGDPFEVTSRVNPLGKFFYSAGEANSETYVATPVSADDFDEKTKSIEIPLLMGMSYEVGTLTLSRTENGFTVSSEISMSGDISPEDYSVENEKLYVYTGRPSLEDLKNHTGKEYAYGEEIPLAEGETLWIADEKDMTILADAIMDLELFDYENSEEYAGYQEQ